MEKINEIKLPKGIDSISVTQHYDKIVIEFIPEKPKFKEGDFVYEDGRIMIVKSYPNMYHANAYSKHSNTVDYNACYGVDFPSPTFRCAAEEEKQLLIDAMKKDGKQWNAEKKCIEDIPVYKDGDLVVNYLNSILIFKKADGVCIFDYAYLHNSGELIINEAASYDRIKRHATTEEKQRMIEALAKKGKRWNADKKCIEDIPNPKFKIGDKVTLKSGCISNPNIEYSSYFNNYIGKKLEVVGYDTYVNVLCDNTYYFSEDWLEPCSEEPKKGDFAIFWDSGCLNPAIRLYHGKSQSGDGHSDNFGTVWGQCRKMEWY